MIAGVLYATLDLAFGMLIVFAFGFAAMLLTGLFLFLLGGFGLSFD